MTMRYFENPNKSNAVYGYDATDPTQEDLIDAAVTANWTEVTGSWPPALTLAQVQTSQAALIDAAYGNVIYADISFTDAAGVTKDYQADADSQLVLLQALTVYKAVGAVPAGFFWKASDNTQSTFTLDDLTNLANDMVARGFSAFATRDTLKTQIAAATTIAAVEAITWPSTVTSSTSASAATTS